MLTYDYEIVNEGSIFLFIPDDQGQGNAVRAWFDDYVDEPMMYGNAYAVDQRYAYDIHCALSDAGFVGH